MKCVCLGGKNQRIAFAICNLHAHSQDFQQSSAKNGKNTILALIMEIEYAKKIIFTCNTIYKVFALCIFGNGGNNVYEDLHIYIFWQTEWSTNQSAGGRGYPGNGQVWGVRGPLHKPPGDRKCRSHGHWRFLRAGWGKGNIDKESRVFRKLKY